MEPCQRLPSMFVQITGEDEFTLQIIVVQAFFFKCVSSECFVGIPGTHHSVVFNIQQEYLASLLISVSMVEF